MSSLSAQPLPQKFFTDPIAGDKFGFKIVPSYHEGSYVIAAALYQYIPKTTELGSVLLREQPTIQHKPWKRQNIFKTIMLKEGAEGKPNAINPLLTYDMAIKSFEIIKNAVSYSSIGDSIVVRIK